MRGMRWIWICAALGCASMEIAPGELPQIQPSEGVLVLGIEAATLVYVNVVGREGGSSFTINPVYVGRDLRAYHVPAGRYCLQQLTFQTSTAMFDPEPCVEVAAGVATLTGFVEAGERIVRKATEEELVRLFEERHPELAKRYSQKRFVELELGDVRGVPLD